MSEEPKSEATHDDILEAVQRLTEIVGYTDFDIHGQLIGKGLVAQVARLDARVTAKFDWIDTLKKQAWVASSVIAVAVVVIWWLAAPRMEKVFHDPPAAERKK